MSKGQERQVTDYLDDILESTLDVREFISGMTCDDFLKDKKTINAVVRSLEVIGEAARNIPDSMRENHPEIT